ncbi:WxL protein peptidoglycan domain-containing protein [Asanoa iriomotensis]|uniref:DUF916 domain-containing protein n=1 Tax=Asanoa iriomotensis TaxID=234613 RepID=A0ABQ4CBF8_9ACTN|nr:DUF916 domain-containing protein [Asanoa iriomotensis]GIF60090.1 hypothetical protein Air01nite_61850 [Asanoa iriomotensis]
MLLSTGVAPAAAVARADESPTWTIVPSSPTGPKGRKQFDYELNTKEAITDWISVSNLGDKPISVDLYATDAFTAADGGFALLPRSAKPDGVGAWVKLPKARTTLPVGKRSDMPFTVTVPADAAPGDHIGGIIASITEQQVNEKGQRVDVERRVAARIYLRVAGPLHPVAAITAVEVDYENPIIPVPGGRMAVTYRVANQGNVRLSGTVRVGVDGPLGMRLAGGDAITVDELLPGSELRLKQEFSSVFPAGRLNTRVDFNPATNRETLPSVSGAAGTTAVPWLILALLVVILGLVVYRILLLRARRRPAPTFLDEAGPTPVPAP